MKSRKAIAPTHDGAPLANYWVHNEFLNMGSEKMSKSLGNVKLIHDLLKDWDGEVIRLALLKAHYRSELVWTEDLLKESKAQLDGWYRILIESSHAPKCVIEPFREVVDELMQDLNTAEAFSNLAIIRNKLSILYSNSGDTPTMTVKDKEGNLVSEHYTNSKDNIFDNFAVERALFLSCANLLGLLQKDPEAWFKGGASADEEAEFDAIALRRQEARAAKDWAAADAARDEATAKGIVLEDGTDGTSWRKA